MSEEFEHAHENLEHAAHGHSHGESKVKPTAIIIAVMAAALAITEFAAKDAQITYLSNHIAASDTWAQYQAKSVRRSILSSEADMLDNLPGSAANATLQKQIAGVRANAERMRSEPGADGMEQLSERAHEQEHLRDHAEHRSHVLEIASGGLQIAIVLASISVVVNMPAFVIVSVVLGVASALYGLLGATSLL
ncbi:MAG TPA: DUF4337 domain-containing protein [Acidobacteriaceae bacterium]